MSQQKNDPKFINLGYILKNPDTGKFTVQVKAFGMFAEHKTLTSSEYVAAKVSEGMSAESAERLQKGQESMGAKYIIVRESKDGKLISVGTICKKDDKTYVLFNTGKKQNLIASARELESEKDKEYAPDNAYKSLLLVVRQ